MSECETAFEETDDGVDDHYCREDEDDIGEWNDPRRKGVAHQFHLDEEIAVNRCSDSKDAYNAPRESALLLWRSQCRFTFVKSIRYRP